MADSEKTQFRNVAVPVEDHALLKELAKLEQRTLAREMSTLIREAHYQLIQEPRQR